MNRSKDLKELTEFYDTLVSESNTGPAVSLEDNIGKPLPHEKNVSEGEMFSKSGPEAADGFKAADNDSKKMGETDNVYNVKKNSDPQKKVSKESINNRSMSDTNNNNETDYKSEFDKLYEFAMEADDDLGELGVDMDDEFGGEDEVEGDPMDPAERLRGIIDELQEILDGMDGGLGDEEELGGFEDELGEEGVTGEAVVSEPEPKALGGHGDRPHPDQGKGPWSSGSGAFDGSGGSAEHGSIPEEPEPKVLGGHGDRSHKDAGNTGSGSNKVKVGKKNNPGAHALGN